MRGPSPRCRSRRRSVTNAARKCSARTRRRGAGWRCAASPRAHASLPRYALAVARACGLGTDRLARVAATPLEVACEGAFDAVEVAQVNVKLIEGDLDAGRAQCLEDGSAQIGLDPAGLGDVRQRDAQGEHQGAVAEVLEECHG